MRSDCSKTYRLILVSFLVLAVLLSCTLAYKPNAPYHTVQAESNYVDVSTLPKWTGYAYIYISNNIPSFSKKQKQRNKPFVKYSQLDKLGRAGKAVGCLGGKTISNSPRASIGSIRPAGWSTKKYPKLINDRYVYNRCHLMMQAAASGINTENCNSQKNLITGTRYLNIDGMLKFENRLLNYLKSTSNHVFYRVTPIYKGSELVPRGVQMEAYSIEDQGRGLAFNVFCYNIQPGITINYSTGETSKQANYHTEIEIAAAYGSATVNTSSVEEAISERKDYEDAASSKQKNTQEYVLNTNTRKIHFPSCPSVKEISKHNKRVGYFSKKVLLKQGYTPCGRCKP